MAAVRRTGSRSSTCASSAVAPAPRRGCGGGGHTRGVAGALRLLDGRCPRRPPPGSFLRPAPATGRLITRGQPTEWTSRNVASAGLDSRAGVPTYPPLSVGADANARITDGPAEPTVFRHLGRPIWSVAPGCWPPAILCVTPQWQTGGTTKLRKGRATRQGHPSSGWRHGGDALWPCQLNTLGVTFT